MNATIHLHYGNYQHIESTWNGTTYYGTCWRLYHNITPGARVITRHETTELMPGHLYLMPPRLAFSTGQTGNPKQLYLHFDAEKPYDGVQQKVYAVPMDDLLKQLLEKTMNNLQPQPFFLSDAGTMYAMALIAAALAQIPTEYIEVHPMDSRIEEAVQYFSDHVDRAINIGQTAKHVGMSPGAFIRLFKQETGATPYAYLMELRITWACDLLTQGTAPIDLIAEYTGFTDRFHFSKVFKKWIGIPPGAYRNREKQTTASPG